MSSGLSFNDSALFAFFLDGYKISDQNVNSGNSNIQYIGMVNRYGNWYIMVQNSDTGSYQYLRGDSGYTTAYAAREVNVYDYFYNIFNTMS